MSKLILATVFVFIAFSFTFSQTSAPPGVGTPAGAGDKNLEDNSVKMRSVELERIKREADKTATIRRDDGVELNFDIIKNDFEGIQKEQDKIVSAYQSGAKIDYEKINTSSGQITEMAIRLKSNLFLPDAVAKDPDKPKASSETPATEKKAMSLRNMIVDLDNAIGEFITNTMFQNLKTIDPSLAKKAESDLDNIIKFSGDLWLESKRIKSN